MKLTNKGFMMAEVIIVSAIALSFLGVIYVSYSKMYMAYKTRLSYYDTVTLYRLGYYRDILIENTVLDTAFTAASGAASHVISVYNSSDEAMNNIFNLRDDEDSNKPEDRVFMVYNNKRNLDSTVLNGFNNVHQTFKDYVSYLSTAIELHSNYVMIMERCNMKNVNGTVTINQDDCKYAYLEVYDGKE